MKKYYIFIAALIVFVIVVVSSQSVLNIGYKADSNREDDIRLLEGDIQTKAEADNHLPEKLADVKLSSKLEGKLDDYTYTILDYNKYKLCTTFVREKQAPNTKYSPYTNDFPDPSYHGKGNQCFTYTVTGVTKPGPIIYQGSGNTTCAIGARDQRYDVNDLTWDGYDANAKTITVHNTSQSQTFRWCNDPIAMNSAGTVIAMSAIPKGAKVKIQATAPGTPNTFGTVTYGVPYVTTISETEPVKVQ